MSDELKYWHMVDAVDQRGPREPSPRAVLRQMARHADSDGIAYPGIARICERTGLAKATVLRAIARLERERWIRVEERAARVETPRGFERKGNLYRLNLVKLGLAVESIACSGTPSAKAENRRGAVEGGFPGSANRTDEGGFPGPQQCDDEGCGPVAHPEGVEGCGPASVRQQTVPMTPVEKPSARSHPQFGEVSSEARRGVIEGPPLIKYLEQEKTEEEEPPYAPPCRGANVQKQPQRQKLPDGEGGSRTVVVFPGRLRTARSASRSMQWRRQIDGEDAAAWDEATRVMKACGVSPERSGRKVRGVVMEALRLAHETGSAASIHAYAELMIERWKEYTGAGGLLFAPVGVTRFFGSADGDNWLLPHMWRYDKEAVKRIRRGGL